VLKNLFIRCEVLHRIIFGLHDRPRIGGNRYKCDTQTSHGFFWFTPAPARHRPCPKSVLAFIPLHHSFLTWHSLP
jgi:hypothetical protein